ncbi:phosphoribosylamine--glycine ligase, partial [Klebsiella pneumoniae]
AAGKGGIVAMTLGEAEAAAKEMIAGHALGEAGHPIAVSEIHRGGEARFIVVGDGGHVLPRGTHQDHKRGGNGDNGPNTGGVG